MCDYIFHMFTVSFYLFLTYALTLGILIYWKFTLLHNLIYKMWLLLVN